MLLSVIIMSAASLPNNSFCVVKSSYQNLWHSFEVKHAITGILILLSTSSLKVELSFVTVPVSFRYSLLTSKNAAKSCLTFSRHYLRQELPTILATVEEADNFKQSVKLTFSNTNILSRKTKSDDKHYFPPGKNQKVHQ